MDGFGVMFLIHIDVAFQRANKQRHIGIPARMGQFDTVAVAQILEIIRKLLEGRHMPLMHQHRNDRNATGESSGDLQPHIVIGVVEASRAIRTGHRSPARTNNGQQNSAT